MSPARPLRVRAAAEERRRREFGQNVTWQLSGDARMLRWAAHAGHRSMTELSLEARSLALHDAQLRSLARALVADESAADDLAQETWLAALEAPGRRVREPGKWLRGVLRHRARGRRRADELRRDHERETARNAWHESDAELVERLSTAELLVRAVDALDAPYGRVLRLRFFEERSVEETARALGCPPGTVTTWTRRGLELLREALDRRERGGRGAWALVLTRFAQPADPRPPLLAGRAGASWWLAGLALVAGAISLWIAAGGAPRIEPVALEGLRPAPGDLTPHAPAQPEPAAEREPLAPASVQVAEAVGVQHQLALRVIDANGRPVSGATVHTQDSDRRVLASAATDAEGRARLIVDDAHLTRVPFFSDAGRMIAVEAFARGLERPLSHFVALPRPADFELELSLGGPAWTLAGRVVDAEGAPVAGAELAAEVERAEIHQVAPGIYTVNMPPVYRSDADGAFACEHLADNFSRFQVSCEGFLSRRLVVERAPDAERVELEIELDRGRTLAGTLLLPDGSPAAGATLSISLFLSEPLRSLIQTVTDDRGRYKWSGLPLHPCWVFASAAGGAPLLARIALGPSAGGEERWDARLERSTPLALRVVDALDRPQPMRILTLSASGSGPPWSNLVHTEKDGRAVLRELPDGPMRLELWSRNHGEDRVMELVLEGVEPSESELVLRVDAAATSQTATLRALLIGSRAEPGLLLAYNEEHRFERAAPARALDGAAELVGLPPGTYVLYAAFRGAGLIALGEAELAAGETFDLYEIELPAREPVRSLGAGALGEATGSLYALYRTADSTRRVSMGELDLTRETTLRLLPGKYRLELARARGLLRIDFQVWPDEPLELDLAAHIAAAEAR